MSARAESLSRLVKAAAPTAIGLVGVLLLSTPVRLVENIVPTPIIPLVVVYFWSIYNPAHLPSASVFVIGLLHDLVSGGPIGLWPTIYLSVQFMVLSQRAYFQGRDQQVVWLGFAVASTIASVIIWLIMSLMSERLLPAGGLVLQMLATVATYPVFAAAFAEFHRRMIVEL